MCLCTACFHKQVKLTSLYFSNQAPFWVHHLTCIWHGRFGSCWPECSPLLWCSCVHLSCSSRLLGDPRQHSYWSKLRLFQLEFPFWMILLSFDFRLVLLSLAASWRISLIQFERPSVPRWLCRQLSFRMSAKVKIPLFCLLIIKILSFITLFNSIPWSAFIICIILTTKSPTS